MKVVILKSSCLYNVCTITIIAPLIDSIDLKFLKKIKDRVIYAEVLENIDIDIASSKSIIIPTNLYYIYIKELL